MTPPFPLCTEQLQVNFSGAILGAPLRDGSVSDRADEKHLLTSVKESGLDAFGVLFERYQPVLFRIVLYQVRDVDEAHDIVQETFTRVWEHRSNLNVRLSFFAYLSRISTNLIRDKHRHNKTHLLSKEQIPPPILPPDADPLEATQYSMLSAQILGIIREQFPDRCRMVFELSRFEGLNAREIASKLKISEKTVENQLTKGLRILRRGLRSFTGG